MLQQRTHMPLRSSAQNIDSRRGLLINTQTRWSHNIHKKFWEESPTFIWYDTDLIEKEKN
jgi:hypothetical protein